MKKFLIITLLWGGLFALAHTAQAGTLTEKGTTSYIEGKFGQAAVIGSTNVVQLEYQNTAGFSPAAGTVEMWVKPQDWGTDTAGYWELLNATDTQGDLFELRRGKDATHDNLQFISYNANGSFNAWVTSPSTPFTWSNDTWYHLAVKWDATTSPVFFVNGVEYAAVPAYSETVWVGRLATEGTVTLGQRSRFYPDATSGQSFHYAARAAFDEVRVSRLARTTAEILAGYNLGAGVLLNVDATTLWLAHFDSALTIDVPTLEGSLYTGCATTATTSSTVSYIDGKVKEAIDLSIAQPLVQYTCNDGAILNPKEGTVEFWFKPGSEWTPTFRGYHHLFSVTDAKNHDRLLIRHGQDSTWNHLQAIFYLENGSFQGWTMALEEQFTWKIGTWYHVALTWSKTGSPTFYINGDKLNMRSAYGATTWTMASLDDGIVTLGTRNSTIDLGSAADADVAMDELRISSVARTLTEIQENYKAGLGKAVVGDSSTLWLTHFDNALTDTFATSRIVKPIRAESAGKDKKRVLTLNDVLAASVSRVRIGNIPATFTLDPDTNVLTLTFDQTKLKPGVYDLQIVYDGKVVLLKNAIIILGKKPTVTSKPVTLARTKRTTNITIRGKNFTDKVTITIGSKKITPTKITRKSSSELLLTVPLTKLAKGSHNVVVTNADRQVVTLKNGIKVN